MKKRLKIFLTVIVSIFSFIFIGNVKAASSDFYDMSQWIDIDEFTLPNGINPDDYNIIIWERGNNGNSNSYRMVYSLKSDNYKIWLSTYPQYLPPSSFPYLTSSPGFSKNRIGGYDSIYYYDETILGSKIFNKKQSSSGSFSSGSYIVYSNYDIFYVNGEKLFDTSKINYDPNPQPHTFNFHLNGGTVRHNYEPINLLFDGTNDFTVELYPNEIEYFITNLQVEKYLMLFEGWYYDSGFTQPFTLNDRITSDVDLYAKFRYEKVEDFLANTTLNMHTFDDNYNYAIINRGDNGDSVYIGLPFEAYNLEVYEYSESEYKVKDGASACPVPLYSKNGYYYYDINTLFTNNQEVLILPRTLFDELDPNNFENPNDIYNFYLSNNGYISYTNDLSQAQIINSSGEQISINLQDSYELSQQYQELYSKPENIFEQMNIFLDKMKKITSAVKDIFSYLFNSLNSTIKLFITYLIIIILVTAIIRFARRG